MKAAPSAARVGGEAGNTRPPLIPGAAEAGRLPSLRVVGALVFLIPGGVFLLAGLVLLWPWLRRLPAVLDRAADPLRSDPASRQPYGPQAHEPSAQRYLVSDASDQARLWLRGHSWN
jgi:UPF0716 family protein affecting phage T7 exclusion